MTPLSQAAELRGGYRSRPDDAGTPLRESDLSRIWEGQTFPPEAMTTTAGVRLRTVYRGRRGRGAGPDFRDAIIAAPAGLLEGDVELHLRSSDFRRHGHHLDPAYDGVVLHLVLCGDEPGDTLLNSGRRIPVVALGDWLDTRTDQLLEWLDSPPAWQEPCRTALDRVGDGSVARTLDKLGDIRFRQKSAACSRQLSASEPDEIAWAGILEALGYGGQRERFREIGDNVPWRLLRCELAAVTGVELRRARASRLLQDAADGLGGGATPVRSVRPANRLVKRLKGAAALAARFAEQGFLRPFVPLLEGEERVALRSLAGAFTVEKSIGRSRAIEIVANVILPLFAAIEDGRWERQAERLWARLALPARYGPVHHLHEAFDGLRIDSRRQQGMLYLLGQYCSQGGCGRCPLS